jgi:hypothetical protein
MIITYKLGTDTKEALVSEQTTVGQFLEIAGLASNMRVVDDGTGNSLAPSDHLQSGQTVRITAKAQDGGHG